MARKATATADQAAEKPDDAAGAGEGTSATATADQAAEKPDDAAGAGEGTSAPEDEAGENSARALEAGREPEDGVTLSAAVRAGIAKVIRPAPVLVVTGPEKGRWRIGRHFTREPVTIPMDELTEEEQMALANDPELNFRGLDALPDEPN